MARNIEIKARLHDALEVVKAVRPRADYSSVLEQTDTFFNCPQGRIKLRQFGDGTAELMYYERDNVAGPKECVYWRSTVSDPTSVREVLAQAYGVYGVVDKTRQLFLIGQSRIHIDEVKNLGTFFEIEVVLKSNQTRAQGEQIARELMREFKIEEADLLRDAYIDLLLS